MNMLPIKTQNEIIDAIRRKEPLRDIAQRFHVALSTVQDYKKHGPPIFRIYSKNPSVESYPATVPEEIRLLRELVERFRLENTQVINQRNTANNENESLRRNTTWADTEIGRLKSENQEKETQLNRQYEKIDELIFICQNLIKNTKKLEYEKGQKDSEIQTKQETLEHYKIDLAKATQLQDFSDEKIRDITRERDEFKDKAESLERKHKSDWMLDLGVALVFFLIGIVADWTVLPKIKDFIQSWGTEHGINTADVAGIISSVNVLQPDIYDKYSGAIPITIASSEFMSGACSTLNGEVHNPRCGPVPTPQDDVTFSPLSSITSGVELITSISGFQCSGAYVSSHLENIPLQDANVFCTSSPLFIPSYSYTPLTPPEHPFDSLLWRQILELEEEQFKQYLKRYFEYLGYRVTLMKTSHDWGVDMIIERGWEKIVIQLKQWKDNVGFGAVREVHAAIEHYKATRSMVICTSSFTKNALELAAENNVECWDGKQLLSEPYNHGYLYPPQ